MTALTPTEQATVTRSGKPLDRMQPDVLARFVAKVDVAETGCWIWTAAQRRNYGAFAIRHGYIVQAHRISYRHFVGPIPPEMDLDHLCKVTLCVNPKHLEPVPPRTNLVRGRGWAGRNARKTHCPEGHAYDAENTYLEPKTGRRQCVTCRRAYKRGKNQ